MTEQGLHIIFTAEILTWMLLVVFVSEVSIAAALGCQVLSRELGHDVCRDIGVCCMYVM